MILSVHAVFGAFVSSLIPAHPIAGFALGFASHLALDAIPHKDYKLTSIEFNIKRQPKLADSDKKNKYLLFDMAFVSVDALLGLFLAYYFFFNPFYPLAFFVGAAGGLLPDFLSFIYVISKQKLFSRFFKFHAHFCHSAIVFKFSHTVGVLLQYLTVAILIGLIFLAYSFIM